MLITNCCKTFVSNHYPVLLMWMAQQTSRFLSAEKRRLLVRQRELHSKNVTTSLFSILFFDAARLAKWHPCDKCNEMTSLRGEIRMRHEFKVCSERFPVRASEVGFKCLISCPGIDRVLKSTDDANGTRKTLAIFIALRRGLQRCYQRPSLRDSVRLLVIYF